MFSDSSKERPGERNEELQVSSEIVENETPGKGLPVPVLSPQEKLAVEKWKIDRVLQYLAFISLTTIIAVSIVPSAEARMMIVGVWLGAAVLTKYLLAKAYRSS